MGDYIALLMRVDTVSMEFISLVSRGQRLNAGVSITAEPRCIRLDMIMGVQPIDSFIDFWHQA